MLPDPRVPKRLRPRITVPRVISLAALVGVISLFVHFSYSAVSLWDIVLIFFLYALHDILMSWIAHEAQEELKLDVVETNAAAAASIIDATKAAGDKAIDQIRRSLTVTYIGTHVEALRYSAERTKYATGIRDTYFRAESDQILPGYPAEIRAVEEGYRSVIQREGFIELILSKHNLASALNFAGIAIDAARERGSVSQYKLYVLEHAKIPIPNMIIFTYPNGQEVLFGWNFNNYDNGIVFSSKDDRTITYFILWYEALKAAAGPPINYGRPLFSNKFPRGIYNRPLSGRK
ncbi:MAG: hypothetical protein JO001_14845 [Alphaproteobacteria bacterium]|nr:hypothetical protein [Alphaproteobacteria bacterium]